MKRLNYNFIAFLILLCLLIVSIYFRRPQNKDLESAQDIIWLSESIIDDVLRRKINRLDLPEGHLLEFRIYSIDFDMTARMARASNGKIALDVHPQLLNLSGKQGLTLNNHVIAHKFANDCSSGEVGKMPSGSVKDTLVKEKVTFVSSCPIIHRGEAVGAVFSFYTGELTESKEALLINVLLNTTDAIVSVIEASNMRQLRHAYQISN